MKDAASLFFPYLFFLFYFIFFTIVLIFGFIIWIKRVKEESVSVCFLCVQTDPEALIPSLQIQLFSKGARFCTQCTKLKISAA